jgi:hypothetical protein
MGAGPSLENAHSIGNYDILTCHYKCYLSLLKMAVSGYLLNSVRSNKISKIYNDS